MIDEIIFDIETQKLFHEIGTRDPADLGVSIVSVYVRQVNAQQQEIHGQMISFWEADLPKMWEFFRKAKRIIGFNSLKFDVPALKKLAPPDFLRLPHFDLMDCIRSELGHSLSLNHLANHTLGKSKTDEGTNAVTYWKSQNPSQLNKLKHYCEMDVLLTKELYDFGVKNKFLKYLDKWNNKKSFAVDFSYPASVLEASKQIGLF